MMESRKALNLEICPWSFNRLQRFQRRMSGFLRMCQICTVNLERGHSPYAPPNLAEEMLGIAGEPQETQ